MPRRNSFIFCSLLVLLSIQAIGQVNSGKVVSRENSIALYEVEITDDSGKVMGRTDEQGFFSIAVSYTHLTLPTN